MKFAAIGDSVSGTITGLRAGEDFNGNPCPVIDLTTAEGEQTVTCGQANLKAQIKALGSAGEIEIGKAISITYARDEKAEKGMRKMFEIKVTDGNKPPF